MQQPCNYMTDAFGHPIKDDNNSLTVSNTGPMMMTDTHFLEKLAHFSRERIPERVVHAKGTGAFGYFRPYQSMSRYTSADFLKDADTVTKVFVRFSTVIGSKGSADTVRDPRGFAVKFYTNQGNYDIVGNDLPVFFIRDAIKFPDVIHSLKPSPDTNLKNPERFWDFISMTPEATHMITWLYSDRGTIKDYAHVDGFGVNTFIWVNANSERFYIKYHFKTLQGIETISRKEAERLAGSDPDIAVRKLHEHIQSGDFPKYELCVQIMCIEDADSLRFDPLDDTKTWPEDEFPLYKVGLLTLNENPVNFFAQVEQAAFCPSNLVPGIEFSNDKMLQGRSFSYVDAQRYRLGVNFASLPVNKPLVPVNNNQQDGFMTYEIKNDPINYSPNSLAGNVPKNAPLKPVTPAFAKGPIVRAPITKEENFYQAGEHYRSLSMSEQAALCENIAVELAFCRSDIVKRVLSYFEAADHAFANGVIKAMKHVKEAKL